jgi:PPOX class probable F420-dependent enzyme
MQEMTPEEIRHFLLDTPRIGKFASVRKDGRPHVAPIWFDLDGETVVFTTWHTTVKKRNILHEPRVSFCVDDDQPPYAFVMIEGTAEITDPPDDERLYWATRIASRYMGEELGVSYGKRNGVPGEHIVRVTPTRIIAHMRLDE